MKSAEAEGLLRPVQRRGYEWTTAEVNIIRRLYSTEGPAACLALLPGRTLSGVYQQGRKLGLSAHVAPRQKRPSSPELDAQIIARYPKATGRGGVAALARELGQPAWVISKRAQLLGLTVPRFRDPPWSRQELAILQDAASLRPEHMRAHLLRAGFNRSATACLVKAKRLKLDRTDPDVWSATGLAQLMGVDNKTPLRWIERDGLRATRAGTLRTAQQGGDEWRIRRRDLREWIRDNPQAVDLRKVDRFWFIELAFGLPT